MDEKVIATRPPSGGEKLLQAKFAESMAAQAELMDKLAQQLLTLELAIPGLYATALKLIGGDKATLSVTWALYLTFGCWFLALLFTLISLIPRQWRVDPTILKQITPAEPLGLEDFFGRSAQYKRRLIIAACLFFFGGIVSAAFTIF